MRTHPDLGLWMSWGTGEQQPVRERVKHAGKQALEAAEPQER
ncbi:MAG: hypothetical protein WC484_08480 [Candidatus Omnitrophota bacterium]